MKQMREPAVGLNVVLEQEEEESIKISLLLNSIYYFIESVFIMAVKEGYRLVVMHRGRLLTDQTYKTVKGARIAFLKLYGYKAWREGARAEWSIFYPPEPQWLNEKFQGIDSLQCASALYPITIDG